MTVRRDLERHGVLTGTRVEQDGAGVVADHVDEQLIRLPLGARDSTTKFARLRLDIVAIAGASSGIENLIAFEPLPLFVIAANEGGRLDHPASADAPGLSDDAVA